MLTYYSLSKLTVITTWKRRKLFIFKMLWIICLVIYVCRSTNAYSSIKNINKIDDKRIKGYAWVKTATAIRVVANNNT